MELGLAYMKEKQWDAALSLLRESQKRHPDLSTESLPPQLLSALGLCLAMGENKVLSGLDFCTYAVEREPFRPEFYFHLGMVHLQDGSKRNAIHCFYKGLKIDPRHVGITSKLRQMGVRKRRSIKFLSRKNPVNKIFGKWVA